MRTDASRQLARLGAFWAFFGVAAGAFAAHGLKGRLPSELLTIWETGARYQMYHALGLLAAAWLVHSTQSKAGQVAGLAFTGGIVLFSGSLYLLALTGVRWLGAITPLGGVLFLVGWGAFFWGAGGLAARPAGTETTRTPTAGGNDT